MIIDELKSICDQLAPHGWQKLLLKHNIDIAQPTAAELANELAKDVTVDRTLPGFEDFISGSAKGVTPGNVASSVLYHALASPRVTRVPGSSAGLGAMSTAIAQYPTLEQLDVVENYIFAVTDSTLDDVRSRSAALLEIAESDVELSVAVFAVEYRSAPGTPHQQHADLCLSRTGVARVGTTTAHYEPSLRGYVPFVDGDTAHTIRALPCRYSAWIAAKSPERPDRFGPARANKRPNDETYWVPVHKIFVGNECLEAKTIRLNFTSRHQNRKIERVHKHMEDNGIPTGFTAAQREQPPFVKENGIADWLEDHAGSRLLGPLPQPLAERAEFEGKHLSFPKPPMTGTFDDSFSPTFTLKVPAPPVRPYPEYAHVRFEVRDGNVNYYGDDPNAESIATNDTLRALNISDSTGDGWIKASVNGLDELSKIPAYSLVACPDFFPGVDQREVYEWWERTQSPAIRSSLPQWLQDLLNTGFFDFWRREPIPLSDISFAPNLKLTDSGFEEDDVTIAAVVSPLQQVTPTASRPKAARTLRHSVLPDSAAGAFAPGWDVSADLTNPAGDDKHFASYGLGSPFPEDAKLCAALSTFWPAAAPDTARTYFEVDFDRGTVCPLTDEENGASAGSVSWDGLRGPRVITEDSEGTVVRYANYPLADYTLNALEGRLSIAQTWKIGFDEYIHRIQSTLRMYRILSGIGNKDSLHILSFRSINSSDAELTKAQAEAGVTLAGPVFRYDVFDESDSEALFSSPSPSEDYSVGRLFTLFIGTSEFSLVLVRIGDGRVNRSIWQVVSA